MSEFNPLSTPGEVKEQVKEQVKEHNETVHTKTLDVKDSKDLKQKVTDIKVIGNADSFQLLCKASSASEGWMKSAKAYEIPGVGCLVQVTTQQGNSVAEALVFVDGVSIVDDVNDGRKLVKTRRGQM